MDLRSSLKENQKVKGLFYLVSLLVIGLFIVDIILTNLDEPNFLKKLSFFETINLNTIYFLDSFLLFFSFITFIFGLFFVKKNWFVWAILELMMTPNIFVLIVFLGFTSLNLFKALSAYLYTITAWFLGW